MARIGLRGCSGGIWLPLWYLVLTGIGAIMVMPFLWMVLTSLTAPGDLFKYPPSLPRDLSFSSYTEVFSRFPFAIFFGNSAKIAVFSTVGTLASASLAA